MSKTQSAPDTEAPTTSPARDSAAPTPAPAAEAADWRGAIADSKLRAFADRMGSPADAVKMAFDLRRKLSRAVIPPGEGAGAEEVRDFHRKLGAPDTAEGYDYTRPDLPDHLRPDEAGAAREKDFLDHALRLGITKDQARGILDWHYRSAVDQSADLTRRLDEGRAQSEAELRREWGADYEANLAAAHRAVTEFGGQDTLDFFGNRTVDGVRLADHPRLVRTFAEAGRRLGEDSLALPGGDFGGPTLEDRVKDVRGRKQEALTRGDRETAQLLDEEERGLWGKIAGEG
jgi:hypothetical protein